MGKILPILFALFVVYAVGIAEGKKKAKRESVQRISSARDAGFDRGYSSGKIDGYAKGKKVGWAEGYFSGSAAYAGGKAGSLLAVIFLVGTIVASVYGAIRLVFLPTVWGVERILIRMDTWHDYRMVRRGLASQRVIAQNRERKRHEIKEAKYISEAEGRTRSGQLVAKVERAMIDFCLQEHRERSDEINRTFDRSMGQAKSIYRDGEFDIDDKESLYRELEVA